MKKKLPNEIQEWFAQQGSKGGKKRAERLTAQRRKEIARKAAAMRTKRLSAAQREEIARKAGKAAAAKRWQKGTE